MDSRLENWKSALRFKTWDIQTLYQPGVALTLVKEFNKCSQCDNRRQGGTSFIVKKNVVPAIKDFKVVNSRLTILIVQGKFFKIAFVNVQAPSEVKSDFNAKIGKEECFKITKRSNGLHQLSKNGFRIIELATGRGLKIKSTPFPHKEMHKVSARFSNSVLDVRTYRGEEWGSDHFLVVGRLKVKVKKAKKSNEEQTELFDIQKLCDLNICEDFRKNILNEINDEHIDYGNDDTEAYGWL
ncbi:hypothetical protein QTP88_017209 [Uroleucon formosanum]